jgi:hypothetical protein
MTEVNVDKIDDFKKFVEAMEVNVRYLLPDNFRYKWVKIDKGKEYYSGEIQYSWSMEYNYKTSGCVGYIYPMSGTQRVTQFKTENGAKRNFIKKYNDYFLPRTENNKEDKK